MSLKTPANPPIATRVESIFSAHGEEWVDYYAWLRADNWQEAIEDPANLPAPIADYLKAENDYYDRGTADLAPLHDELVGPEKVSGSKVRSVTAILILRCIYSAAAQLGSK